MLYSVYIFLLFRASCILYIYWCYKCTLWVNVNKINVVLEASRNSKFEHVIIVRFGIIKKKSFSRFAPPEISFKLRHWIYIIAVRCCSPCTRSPGWDTLGFESTLTCMGQIAYDYSNISWSVKKTWVMKTGVILKHCTIDYSLVYFARSCALLLFLSILQSVWIV